MPVASVSQEERAPLDDRLAAATADITGVGIDALLPNTRAFNAAL